MSVIAEMADEVRASNDRIMQLSTAMVDLAEETWTLALDDHKVNACFDAYEAGDFVQFGHLLAKELRLRMQREAHA